jgi:Flp pilus assembly protein protease CpaA
MSAVALLTRPPDLRHLYRRLIAAPTSHKVLLGLAGPVAFGGVCLLADLPPAAGLLVWLVGVAVVTDLLWRRIFNWVTAPAAGLMLAFQLLALLVPGVTAATRLPDPLTALAGFGLCLGLMLLLYFAFRGGEGDVKLVAVLGAVLGPRDGLETAVGGYLLAAVVALGILGYRAVRRLTTGVRPARRFTAGTLPMAPFFASAALLCQPAFGGV